MGGWGHPRPFCFTQFFVTELLLALCGQLRTSFFLRMLTFFDQNGIDTDGVREHTGEISAAPVCLLLLV